MNLPSVSSIFIYPVKGLSGIELNSCKVLTEGLENDRRLMLVDSNGKFISQREHSILSLFKCSIKDAILKVEFKDSDLDISLMENLNYLTPVSVWNSKLKASQYQSHINEWFSDHLNQKCNLVKLDSNHRRFKRLFVPPFSTYVSFADGYPILLLSEASMALLNSKLEKQLLIDRFRANIIINNCEAHEEDEYGRYRIGDVEFKNIKPCARCIVTTIDQQTAERSPEPLKTLSSYRKKGNKIFFGVNSICLKEGIIQKDNILEFK